MFRELQRSKWPNKTRNAIFDIEYRYKLSSVEICLQCGNVHQPKCIFDAITARCPAPDQSKEKPIFIRTHRWWWLIEVKKDEPEITRLNRELEKLFDDIKKKNDDELDESEKYLKDIADVDLFKYYFCDCIARVMEELTSNIKYTGFIGGKIKTLGVFAPPYDLFIKMLLNLSVIVREDGEVSYETTYLNAKAKEFVSNFKTKTNPK